MVHTALTENPTKKPTIFKSIQTTRHQSLKKFHAQLKKKTVKTNIGRIFIKLISKHFPPNHKFVKIFNKNTIKRSYSCMPNIRSKIKGHKKQILQPKPTEPKQLCNCLVKEDCPMNGLSLTSSILENPAIVNTDKKDTKESVKRHSRNVIQTTKNHSTLLSLKMTSPYL